MTSGPQVVQQRCKSCEPRSRCVLSVVVPKVLDGAGLRVSWLPFGKGETIFHEATPAPGWVILCRGWVKLVVRTDRGRNLVLRVCRPGELLAGLTWVLPPYSGLAVTPCLVGFILSQDVGTLGRQHPEVLREVNRRLAEVQRRLVQRLADLAYASVRTRLVRVLLDLGEEHGEAEDDGLRISVPLSLRDLAEMIGASKQATCKELQLLRAKGLIDAVWPRVFLSDLERLRQVR